MLQLPWRDLSAGLTDAGWLDLTNRRSTLTVGETVLAFAGVDDPHLEYDDLAAVAGPADPGADVRLGIAHAPYLRVLDQFAADGHALGRVEVDEDADAVDRALELLRVQAARFQEQAFLLLVAVEAVGQVVMEDGHRGGCGVREWVGASVGSLPR